MRYKLIFLKNNTAKYNKRVGVGFLEGGKSDQNRVFFFSYFTLGKEKVTLKVEYLVTSHLVNRSIKCFFGYFTLGKEKVMLKKWF